MRRVLVLLLLLLCLAVVGCKKEEVKVDYLQKEDVQLVQPRIIASTTVIDSFVTIKADRLTEGTLLFYTDDSTEPTEQSIKFSGEIKIKEPKELKFKAFHNKFKASETASVKLYKKGHTASDIKWFTNPNQRYEGSGATTLIDDKKGSMDFNSPLWVGFDTIAKANVKFDKKITIKSIDIGYLNDPGSWIFPPSEIEVIINNKASEKLTFQLEPITTMIDRTMMSFRIPINHDVKTLSIAVKNVEQIPDWHDGKGNKAWLFMDEWIFN